MSISAAATTQPWSWPNGMDPSAATSGTQTGAGAFQASLLRWQDTTTAGIQGTTSVSTTGTASAQPDQPGTNGVQQHHHHHYVADGSQQSSGGQNAGYSIQSTLSSLVGDIASALQANGSATSGTGTAAGTSADASLQSVADTLVSDIAQATQASGSGATTTSTTASAGASGTAASIQAAENTLAADIALALQAYGVNQTAGGNVLASV